MSFQILEKQIDLFHAYIFPIINVIEAMFELALQKQGKQKVLTLIAISIMHIEVSNKNFLRQEYGPHF